MKGRIELTRSQWDMLEVQVRLRKEIIEKQIQMLEERINQHSSFTPESRMMMTQLEMLMIELDVLNVDLKKIEDRLISH